MTDTNDATTDDSADELTDAITTSADGNSEGDTDEPNFEPFLQKGGHLVTTKTASVTLNHQGHINIPGSVREQIFDNAQYIQYHRDLKRGLLAFEGFPDEDSAPANAYKIGGESGHGTISATNVLTSMDYEIPDEQVLFELKYHDGYPYIDLNKLETVDDDQTQTEEP